GVRPPGLGPPTPSYLFSAPDSPALGPPPPPLDSGVDPGSGLPIDGGLPRHVVTAGTSASIETRYDFHKEIKTATVKWLAEGGEPVEQVAMNFHATAGGFATATPLGRAATFKVTGHPAKPGAAYADPCFDDSGNAITDVRYYKAADIQLDVKLNKAGWPYPQSRILALWGDANSLLAGTKAPEPFFFRASSGQCI